MRKIISIILVLAVMWAPAGCGGGAAQNTDNSYYTPVTVQNYGRDVTVDSMPQKVVTAGPDCTELMIALGLSDKLAGCCCNNHSRGPLKQWEAEYEKIPEITYGSPTLEAVVGSGCDFFFGIDWVFSGDFTVEALEEYGITVYVCEAQDYDDIWREIRELGEIFGVQEAAEEFISSEKSRIKEAEEAVADEEPLKVLVYDSDTGNGVYTAGGPNIETLFIQTAGGINIFKDIDKAWASVSYEKILEAEPDAVIIHDYEEASYEENTEKLKKDPILSQLDCVRNERFIKLSLESALPGSRTAYSIEQIAKGLFPDKF